MSNFEKLDILVLSSLRSTSTGLCPKNFEKSAHPSGTGLYWFSKATQGPRHPILESAGGLGDEVANVPRPRGNAVSSIKRVEYKR